MTATRSNLIAFIERRTGATGIQWTPASPIEQTLGMAELDTIIFYEDFVKQFNIQIPEDWDFSNHVSPVGCYDWRHYLRRLFSKNYRKQTTYIDLTFGDLEDMITTGIWKDLRPYSTNR